VKLGTKPEGCFAYLVNLCILQPSIPCDRLAIPHEYRLFQRHFTRTGLADYNNPIMALYHRFIPRRGQAFVSQGLVIQAWQLPDQSSPQPESTEEFQNSQVREGLTIRLRSNRRKQTRRAVSDLRETPLSDQLDQTIAVTGPIIKPKRAKQQARTASIPKSPGVYLGCKDSSGLKLGKARLPSVLMLRLVSRSKRHIEKLEPLPRPKSRLITLDCPPPLSPQHQYSQRQRHKSEAPLIATSPLKRSKPSASFSNSPTPLDHVFSHPTSPHKAPKSLHHLRAAEDYDPDYEFSMQSYYLS
jgi:hypothetical protein